MLVQPSHGSYIVQTGKRIYFYEINKTSRKCLVLEFIFLAAKEFQFLLSTPMLFRIQTNLLNFLTVDSLQEPVMKGVLSYLNI